jgi:hypothetical protein
MMNTVRLLLTGAGVGWLWCLACAPFAAAQGVSLSPGDVFTYEFTPPSLTPVTGIDPNQPSLYYEGAFVLPYIGAPGAYSLELLADNANDTPFAGVGPDTFASPERTILFTGYWLGPQWADGQGAFRVRYLSGDPVVLSYLKLEVYANDMTYRTIAVPEPPGLALWCVAILLAILGGLRRSECPEGGAAEPFGAAQPPADTLRIGS